MCAIAFRSAGGGFISLGKIPGDVAGGQPAGRLTVYRACVLSSGIPGAAPPIQMCTNRRTMATVPAIWARAKPDPGFDVSVRRDVH